MANITGLIFPASQDVPDSNAESVRFRWANPQSNGLPIYGASGVGVTYLWRYMPLQQNGYHTTFFWGNDDGLGTIDDTFLWQGGPGGTGNTYYGAQPYPPGGESDPTHTWAISVEQQDQQGAAMVTDRWHAQALVAWGAAGVAKQHEFYWDLPKVDAGHKVTKTTTSSTYGDTNPPSPYLTFGDAPWRPGGECNCGVLRGFQIYATKLTELQILTELSAPLSTSAGAASIWYLKMNPTPDDLTDESGGGHHPAWLNATKKAGLWSKVVGDLESGRSSEFLRRQLGRTI